MNKGGVAAPKTKATKAGEEVKEKVNKKNVGKDSNVKPQAEAKQEPVVPKRAKENGFGIVKEVVSGDSIVLAGSAAPGAPTRQITISGILAPRMGRYSVSNRGEIDEDQPFAWHSREFLRQKLIGQKVAFSVNYAADSGRDFANVEWNGQNVASMIVAAGWATVKEQKSKDGEQKVHPEREALLQLQSQAKAAGLGVHSRASHEEFIRIVNRNPDVLAVLQKYKNKAVPAIIDQVRDGSTLRVELLGEHGALTHTLITLRLAGVLAPKVPLSAEFLKKEHEEKLKTDPEAQPRKAEDPEPFAIESLHFSEMRLLNREVRIVLQSADKFNNFFGSVQFSKGNISEKLLEKGLAKLVPWSAALTPDEPLLRQAQKQAQDARAGIWQTATPAVEEPLSNEFHGVVVQVVSGDLIVVQDHEGKEHRIPLASVRARRMGARGKADEPFAFEAREYLRKALISKKVRVVPEYVRELRPNLGEDSKEASVQMQEYSSVFLGNQNLGELLVANGLAEVIRHQVHEPRSSNYEALMLAENRAIAQKLGMHAKNRGVARTVMDLSERFRKPEKKAADSKQGGKEDQSAAKQRQISARVKNLLMSIGKGQIPAVVEHVFSGSRLKIFLPKENVFVAFVLAGVKVPKDEHVSTLALQLAKRCLQHDVAVEVETSDKGDNLIGSLFFNNRNLAVDLLQQGLAEIYSFSADKSPYSRELYAAEREAKEARRQYWKDYEEKPEVKTEDGEVVESKDGKKVHTVKITEIVDAVTFYVHIAGDPKVEEMEQKMKEFGESPEEPAPLELKRGIICAGLFGDEEQVWCRVKVESVGQTEHKVFFMDYGNHETLTTDQLCSLPEELRKPAPLAHPCVLAGVRAPSSKSEFSQDATYAFNDLTFGDELQATIELEDRFGRWHVTLQDPESPDSINRLLVQQGWVRVLEKPEFRLKSYCESLQPDMKAAISSRVNQWQYGNVSDDEEDENEGHRQQRGRGRRY